MFLCLISSTLILNVSSQGLKSKDFSMLKGLMKLQNHFDFDNLEHKEDIKYLFPKLFITMRDFTHEIKQKGVSISGT